MKKIDAYKTVDGIIFEKELDAVVHEAKKVMETEMLELCDNMYFRDMGADRLAEILLENKEAILKILSKAKV